MAPVNRRPTAFSGYLGAAAAALGAAVVAFAAVTAALVGTAGAVLVAAGVVVGSTAAVTTGSLVVFGGVVLAGATGAGVPTTLAGTLAAVLAWDLGEQSVDVGRQVGRDAPTVRGEAGHAVASLAVGAAAVGVARGIYVAAAGGLPSAALAVLVTAAVLLTVALRP